MFGCSKAEVERHIGASASTRDANGLADGVSSISSYPSKGAALGFDMDGRWTYLTVGQSERATVLWKRMPFAIASQTGEPSSSIKQWLTENGLAFVEASGDFDRTVCVPAQGVTFSFDDLTGELLGIQLRATADS